MHYMIDTENTQKAITTLQKYTSKPIEIKNINELKLQDNPDKPVTYLGATDETDNKIIIWLSDKCPEETFVHEVIHRILKYEGFPEVFFNEDFINKRIPSNYHKLIPKLGGYLSSTITHPEVFRRMESDYSFDLDKYYKIQLEQKLKRFDKILKSNTKDKDDIFFIQQEILTGLDYYLWGEENKNILFEIQKENFPSAYHSCLALYKKCNKIGLFTPDAAYKSANIIKKHIITYGERNSIKKEINNLWRALDIRKD